MLTQEQKNQIALLRENGNGYGKIAQFLGLTVKQVRGYCTRSDAHLCPQCGKRVRQSPHKKDKKFCSDTCRMTWWHRHPEKGNRNPHHTQVCPVCHTDFPCFRARTRIYCSRACYAEARRKAVDGNA